VAWLKFGENSFNYFLLDNCHRIFVGKADILYFVVNTMFKHESGDGSSSFVAVQVAKLQSVTQRTVEPTIERNDKWCREVDASNLCKDTVIQTGFKQQGIKGLTARQFFELHRAVPFDDGAIKYKSLWWHGTPIGGVSGSADRAAQYSWDLDMFGLFPDRTLLSSRLYGFAFSRDASQVPFEIGIRGAEELRFRIMSPLIPGDPDEYVLQVVRK
jgi:hypothetical protein